jgi:hypothetical protein
MTPPDICPVNGALPPMMLALASNPLIAGAKILARDVDRLWVLRLLGDCHHVPVAAHIHWRSGARSDWQPE